MATQDPLKDKKMVDDFMKTLEALVMSKENAANAQAAAKIKAQELELSEIKLKLEAQKNTIAHQQAHSNAERLLQKHPRIFERVLV